MRPKSDLVGPKTAQDVPKSVPQDVGVARWPKTWGLARRPKDGPKGVGQGAWGKMCPPKFWKTCPKTAGIILSQNGSKQAQVQPTSTLSGKIAPVACEFLATPTAIIHKLGSFCIVGVSLVASTVCHMFVSDYSVLPLLRLSQFRMGIPISHG